MAESSSLSIKIFNNNARSEKSVTLQALMHNFKLFFNKTIKIFVAKPFGRSSILILSLTKLQNPNTHAYSHKNVSNIVDFNRHFKIVHLLWCTSFRCYSFINIMLKQCYLRYTNNNHNEESNKEAGTKINYDTNYQPFHQICIFVIH